jgi:hypothetical protein
VIDDGDGRSRSRHPGKKTLSFDHVHSASANINRIRIRSSVSTIEMNSDPMTIVRNITRTIDRVSHHSNSPISWVIVSHEYSVAVSPSMLKTNQ